MGGQPLADERAVMHRDIVGKQMDGGDRGWDRLVEVREEGEGLDLALAASGHPVDLPGAGVEGGEQVGGTGPTVLMLDLDRSSRLGGPGQHAAWSWLER